MGLDSNAPNLKQNQTPNEVDLNDVLNQLKKEIFLSLNCHGIGTVQTFDPIRQVVSVTLNYKKVFFEPDPVTGVVNPKLRDYPILLDCPTIFLGGGLGALTFPVSPGDECLVFFNDRDIDNWFSGSSNSSLATLRKHSMADAIALVGVRSLANTLLDFNSNASEIRYGANKFWINAASFKAELAVGVSFEITAAGKLKITNLTGEFVAALIQCLSTATCAGFPVQFDLTTLLTFLSV